MKKSFEYLIVSFVFLISKYDYAQLRDRRAESPKAHSMGQRPMYKVVSIFAL